jgi:hypothetical protein
MSDTIKKTLSDADGRTMSPESVEHAVDVAREQEEKTLLQQTQDML